MMGQPDSVPPVHPRLGKQPPRYRFFLNPLCCSVILGRSAARRADPVVAENASYWVEWHACSLCAWRPLHSFPCRLEAAAKEGAWYADSTRRCGP
jgi:hypothetical protein